MYNRIIPNLIISIIDSSQIPGGEPFRPGTANVGFSSFANLYGRQLLLSEAEHIFTHGKF